MEYKKPWNVKVVRRRFETTSIEQLEDGDEDDWKRPISILFIGEEGIDAGGLSTEFVSLLFKTTKVFEENTFSVDPHLLDSKHYRLIGKAVGKAIISGHPGPRCLNHHVTQYILQGQEPDFSSKGYHWCKEPTIYIVNLGKKCALCISTGDVMKESCQSCIYNIIMVCGF